MIKLQKSEIANKDILNSQETSKPNPEAEANLALNSHLEEKINPSSSEESMQISEPEKKNAAAETEKSSPAPKPGDPNWKMELDPNFKKHRDAWLSERAQINKENQDLKSRLGNIQDEKGSLLQRLEVIQQELTRLESETLENLRLKLCLKEGLNDALAKYIKGANEDEILQSIGQVKADTGWKPIAGNISDPQRRNEGSLGLDISPVSNISKIKEPSPNRLVAKYHR